MRFAAVFLSLFLLVVSSAPSAIAHDDHLARITELEAARSQLQNRVDRLETAIKNLQNAMAKQTGRVGANLSWIAKQAIMGSCSTSDSRDLAFEAACKARNFKLQHGGECLTHSRGRVIVSVLCAKD